MEENINKKNNIQVNALNVGTEKASSKYYSYQNDSTDIIQANTNKFNKNQKNRENETSKLFEATRKAAPQAESRFFFPSEGTRGASADVFR